MKYFVMLNIKMMDPVQQCGNNMLIIRRGLHFGGKYVCNTLCQKSDFGLIVFTMSQKVLLLETNDILGNHQTEC